MFGDTTRNRNLKDRCDEAAPHLVCLAGLHKLFKLIAEELSKPLIGTAHELAAPREEQQDSDLYKL